MKKLLLPILMLLASTVWATDVTVSSYAIPWTGPTSDVQIRFFLVGDGSTTVLRTPQNQSIRTGTPASGTTNYKYDCTYSGGNLTIPSVVLPATTDGVGGGRLRWSAVFYRKTPGTAIQEWSNYTYFQVPHAPASTSWTAIKAYNDALGTESDPSKPYTRLETEAKIADVDATKANRAGDTFLGPVVLPGDAVSSLQAIPKQQLDAATQRASLAEIQARVDSSKIVTSDKLATQRGKMRSMSRASLPGSGVYGDGATIEIGDEVKLTDSSQDVVIWNGFRWIPMRNGRISPLDKGAIGDGASHPLSTRYNTLAAAQAVYPFASSLTQEIDWAAIVACVKLAGTAGFADGINIDLGSGAYYVTDEILIEAARTHIGGLSKRATSIIFAPSSAKTLFKFSAGLAVLYQCSLRHLSLVGAGTAQKTGVELIDTSEFIADDVEVSNSWTGNNSIGMFLKGREKTTIRDVSNFANLPFKFGDNPNSNIDADHLTMEGIYTITPTTSNPNILIEGSNLWITNWTIRGWAAVHGKYFLYYVDGGGAIPRSMNWNFSDLRWEQCDDPTGYAFYVTGNVAYSKIQASTLADEGGGFYLRGVRWSHLDTIIHGGSPVAVSLNLDGTDEALVTTNFAVSTTKTATITGLKAVTQGKAYGTPIGIPINATYMPTGYEWLAVGGGGEPSAPLDVYEPGNTSHIAKFGSGGGGGYVTFYDYPVTANRGYVGFGASILGLGTNSTFGLRSQGELSFTTNGGSTRLHINANGKTGIGTITDLSTFAGAGLVVDHANGWIQANDLFTFNGQTSSNPALKASGNTLQSRLGDDSGYAPFAVSTISLNSNGTAAASGGAATLNTQRGTITSESLTTAAGAVYTLTLTNSQITTSSQVFPSLANGTNTQGTLIPGLVTPGSGSVTIEVRNIHASQALNGTIKVSFIVYN